MKNYLNFNREKGITLIALVITIIVLLILAGVSIAMLTGQNGILTQANTAKTKNIIEKEKEEIKVAYNGAKIETRGQSITVEDLQKQFDTNRTNAIAENENSLIKVTFSETGNMYTIDSNGNISEEEKEEIVEVTDKNPGILEDLGNDTYGIYSIEDLVAFSYQVNSGNELYYNKTVILGLSLDFNNNKSYADANKKYSLVDAGYEPNENSEKTIKELLTDRATIGFIPIGKNGNTFAGDFDGKGFEIINIYINVEKGCSGLFSIKDGDNTENTEIKNLGIKKGDIRGEGPTGAIIGYITSGEVRIKNCYNTANISSTSNSGGIVGNCTGSQMYIENCYNKGAINGKINIGGIAGYVRGYQLHMKDCYNIATIHNGRNSGGVIGNLSADGEIENCYNEGNVKSGLYEENNTNTSGGIVGIIEGNIIINNSKNSGTIEGILSIAGIAGDVTGNSKIINSYNSGNIIRSQTNLGIGSGTGGIAGHIRKGAEIKNCYNMGNINIGTMKNEGSEYDIAPADVGGIVGTVSGAGSATGEIVASIKNCCNYGKIDAIDCIEGYRSSSILAGGILGNTMIEGKRKI